MLPALPEGAQSPTAVHTTYPIEAIGRLHGVVVLHLAPRPESELQAALRQLHWGAARVELLFVRDEVYRERGAKSRLQTVLELIGAAAGHERYAAAATALATELATRLHCERVIIGFLRGSKVHIDAVSHSAQFKERTNLLKSVAGAMEEAIDQGMPVLYPPLPGTSAPVSRAHADLSQSYGSDAICTVPLACAGKAVGAITFERSSKRPFDADTVELCEALAGLAVRFSRFLSRLNV